MECSPLVNTLVAIMVIMAIVVIGGWGVVIGVGEVRDYRESTRRRDAVLHERAESARRREKL